MSRFDVNGELLFELLLLLLIGVVDWSCWCRRCYCFVYTCRCQGFVYFYEYLRCVDYFSGLLIILPDPDYHESPQLLWAFLIIMKVFDYYNGPWLFWESLIIIRVRDYYESSWLLRASLIILKVPNYYGSPWLLWISLIITRVSDYYESPWSLWIFLIIRACPDYFEMFWLLGIILIIACGFPLRNQFLNQQLLSFATHLAASLIATYLTDIPSDVGQLPRYFADIVAFANSSLLPPQLLTLQMLQPLPTSLLYFL